MLSRLRSFVKICSRHRNRGKRTLRTRQMPGIRGRSATANRVKTHEFPTAVHLDKRPESVLKIADFLCHLTEKDVFGRDKNRQANKIRPAFRRIAHLAAPSPPVFCGLLYFAYYAPGRAFGGISTTSALATVATSDRFQLGR